jgi:hypothetical protein
MDASGLRLRDAFRLPLTPQFVSNSTSDKVGNPGSPGAKEIAIMRGGFASGAPA